jgi:hypothetical protein
MINLFGTYYCRAIKDNKFQFYDKRRVEGDVLQNIVTVKDRSEIYLRILKCKTAESRLRVNIVLYRLVIIIKSKLNSRG